MSLTSNADVNLQPFERRWAETILKWVTSAEELRLWAARSDYPLTDATVFDEWRSDPEITAYMLLTEDEPVAYGELWLDETDESAELGRLIVSPKHRRKGFGRLLIDRLVSAGHAAGYPQTWVRVFPENEAAIDCYESAGFRRVSCEQQEELNASQRFRFVWMKRR